MRRTYLTAALLLVAALLAGTALAGNPDRLGTAGAQELRIPVGTRGLALGGSTVAANHGLESVFYNPAGLGATVGTEALFANTNYIADMKVRYFALATRQSFGVLGVSVKVLDLGDLYVTRTDAPDGTGEVESISFAVLGLHFARYVTDAISFGATGCYINESVLSTKAQGVAFDLGLHYDSDWRGAKFGLAMKNVGPNMRFNGSDFEYTLQVPGDRPDAANRTVRALSADFELPSYFVIGASIPAWTTGENQVSAYGGFQSNNFANDEIRGGVEYGYKDLLMVRGGYSYSDQDDYLLGPSFGLGVNLPLGGARVSVDYAFQTIDSWFDDLHTFSANFTF